MAISVGDKVTCSANYTYDGNTRLASFVRSNTYEVLQVGGKNLPDDRIVIGINGKVTAAVKASDLTSVSNTTTPMPREDVIQVSNPEPSNTISIAPIDYDSILANVQKNTSKSNFSANKGSMDKFVVTSASQQRDTEYRVTSNETRISTGQYSGNNRALNRKEPSIIQNSAGFPRSKGFDSSVGYYRYNYYMDYERDGMLGGLHVGYDDSIRRSLNIDVMSRAKLAKLYSENYNKFKLGNTNDILSKSFAHVFFVRPDCNIFEGTYRGGLSSTLNVLSEFHYAKKHAPEVLRQLTQSAACYPHEFSMLLSNRAESFEVSDEYIDVDTYGESMTGYGVPYGKSNVKSKTAGKFSIQYHDDRDLHIYHCHRLWTNYISYVYRGKVYPADHHIINKVLDYPTCVYYILTAEDGETIIFWSKYWGVFPLEAPSSSFSFTKDNNGGLANPDLRIEYQYAWKEDFNPLSLIEFNTHSNGLPKSFVPNFNRSTLSGGYTWAGPPFIETCKASSNLELPYTFKLRFRGQ